MSARYADPIPELEEVLAEARPRMLPGDRDRHATAACDAWGVPDGPLVQRLIELAFRGRHRPRPVPVLAEGAEELCAFACDCHGIEADAVLSYRLGVLAGRAP